MAGSGSTPGARDVLGDNWGWFVALGALLVGCGVIALGSLVATTLATVSVAGLMLVLGGAIEILHGLRAQAWGRFLWQMLSGALAIVGGIFAVIDPLLASAAITLLIGLALIVAGGLRIALGIALRHAESWAWVVLGGMVTLLCGVLIASRWPFSALWVIGALLALSLLGQGLTWIQFGLAVRRRGSGA